MNKIPGNKWELEGNSIAVGSPITRPKIQWRRDEPRWEIGTGFDIPRKVSVGWESIDDPEPVALGYSNSRNQPQGRDMGKENMKDVEGWLGEHNIGQFRAAEENVVRFRGQRWSSSSGVSGGEGELIVDVRKLALNTNIYNYLFKNGARAETNESSGDASEVSLTPLMGSSRDELMMSDLDGLTALNACYQQLLNLQKARSEYEGILGRRGQLEPVFKPTQFTKIQLLELMRFSELQFGELNKAIQAHEQSLKVTSTCLGTVWSNICEGRNVDQVLGVNNSLESGSHGTSSTQTLPYIHQLKSSMESWRSFSVALIETTRTSIQNEGSAHFMETESVATLLKVLNVLIAEVHSKLVLVLYARNLLAEAQAENQEKKHFHKMSLPFRAEDPVELPQIRFPPTRKQHCAPRYPCKKR